jgi:KDO2-lipid IV(A) lauroyltransferase
MRLILNYLEYFIVLILIGFTKLLGIDKASSFIGSIARFIGPFLKVSLVAKTNLELAFPDWPQSKIQSTIKDAWENLGRTAAELPFIFNLSDVEINKRLKIKNISKIKAILSQTKDKPIIFVGGHFSNWEMMIKALLLLNISPSVVYRKSNNHLLNNLINKLRHHPNVEHIHKGQEGVIKMFKSLKQKRSIALLVDQKLNTGIKIKLLNKDAMTTDLPAKLALKFDLPIIYGEIVRHNGAYFTFDLKPIKLPKKNIDPDESIRIMTQTINDHIEKQAKTYPGQWFWLHRRFDKNFYY